MKTAEEILEEKGITIETKFHNYEYLYHNIVKCMEKYAQMKVNELNKSAVIKSVCGCGYNGTYEKDGLIFCKCCDNRKI